MAALVVDATPYAVVRSYTTLLDATVGECAHAPRAPSVCPIVDGAAAGL